MDIKGAGTLKEKVYMWQPEGYDDGSGQVCLLEKMLYGLKQSEHELNKELVLKLTKHGCTLESGSTPGDLEHALGKLQFLANMTRPNI
jgi:hypothetical protein